MMKKAFITFISLKESLAENHFVLKPNFGIPFVGIGNKNIDHCVYGANTKLFSKTFS